MTHAEQMADFSKLIKVDDISKKQALKEKIAANQDECAALAERLGLLTVSSFSGVISIAKKKGDLIVMDGECSVTYQQECAVTLKPLDRETSFTFTTFFTENEVEYEQDEDMAYIQPSDDDKRPEQIIDGKIDIADTAVQYFSLEIDPYPKSEEADFDDSVEKAGLKNEKENPFAVLAALKEEK